MRLAPILIAVVGCSDAPRGFCVEAHVPLDALHQGIYGRATLQQIDGQPPPAPGTSIQVFSEGAPFGSMIADAAGVYATDLPIGTFTLCADQRTVGCITVEIHSNERVRVDLVEGFPPGGVTFEVAAISDCAD